MLSYPIYIMALIHSFFLGTDSSLPLVRFMYLSSIVLILGLTAARFAISLEKKQTPVSAANRPQLIMVPAPQKRREQSEHDV